MKKFKSERGAITIIVLASLLLFTALLGSMYMVISNKIKSQKDAIKQTEELYKENAEDAYNSFFSNGTIPIYENSQYLKIGTGENVQINNKYYIFSDKALYILLNDLIFEDEDEIVEKLESISENQKLNINLNRTHS